MLFSVIAIMIGGSCGCLLRWFLGMQLNNLFPTLPPGTLAANLLGGYLIGLAVAFFSGHPELPPQWRLLVITGFLGGLTTFSTFSAETATLIQQGRLFWACGEISVHVVGSLVMTLLGIATVSAIRHLF
jgi:CrcB protein